MKVWVKAQQMLTSRQISSSRKPLVPNAEETEDSKQIIEAACGTRVVELAIRIKDRSGASKTLALPARVGHFVLEALSEIAGGNAIRLVQMRRELTSHEAAELLNVSRTFLIGLLEKGVIPYRLVGSHRRIGLTDLLAYKAKTDFQRKEALDAIAGEGQELKLYD
ncbi:MAG: excisionase family DNA-binding protein [Candidatus Binataceae bacterium]